MVAVAAAIASTWPVALHWRDHVVDGARLINPKDAGNWWAANIGADVLTTVWVVNWVLHALVTQPLHLFEANVFYPAPHALARSEHIVATALLGVPGRLLAGPVAAHQSALLLCIALNVWATAYLVTRWTGSLLGGLVAGLLFAVSPFHQGGFFTSSGSAPSTTRSSCSASNGSGRREVPRGLRSLQWRSCCSS